MSDVILYNTNSCHTQPVKTHKDYAEPKKANLQTARRKLQHFVHVPYKSSPYRLDGTSPPREGVYERVAVPPACCHRGSRALPGVRCQMHPTLLGACFVSVRARDSSILDILVLVNIGLLFKSAVAALGKQNPVSAWGAGGLAKRQAEEVCQLGSGHRELRAGSSPVSVSAAVLRRHKVTLCLPPPSRAGEQSGIHHSHRLMHTKASTVGLTVIISERVRLPACSVANRSCLTMI